MDYMNDSKLCSRCSRCYEQLRVMDGMNDSRSSAQGSRCYEQLKIEDDMNESRSYQIRALDVMNNSGLWMM